MPGVPRMLAEIFERMSEAADTGDEMALRESFDRFRGPFAEITKTLQGLAIAESQETEEKIARLNAEAEEKIARLNAELTGVRNQLLDGEKKIARLNSELRDVRDKLLDGQTRVGPVDIRASILNADGSDVLAEGFIVDADVYGTSTTTGGPGDDFSIAYEDLPPHAIGGSPVLFRTVSPK